LIIGVSDVIGDMNAILWIKLHNVSGIIDDDGIIRFEGRVEFENFRERFDEHRIFFGGIIERAELSEVYKFNLH
jgi:hypothetical protein